MVLNQVNSPIISIVTVVYNGSATLRRTIESIVPQICDNVEYLIIDGGSSDGTVNIIREYEHHLAYWHTEPDHGIFDAWNKGVSLARGKFISFIGADDTVEPNAYTTYLENIKSFQDVEYWSSHVALGDRQGRVIGRPWSWHNFRRYMSIAHVGSLHRRDIFERYGQYDTSYKIAGDYELLLRAGGNLKAGFIDMVTVVMGTNGVSNEYSALALKETRLAKVSTHSCGRITADIDYIWAYAKLFLRRLLFHK